MINFSITLLGYTLSLTTVVQGFLVKMSLFFSLPFARLLIQVAVRTSDRSWLPAASCTRHVLENAAGSLAAMACEA